MIRLERRSNVCGNAMEMVLFPMQCNTDVLDIRYHRCSCDYQDLNNVDDGFRCFCFTQFLVGFHDFPRHFHGFS